MITTEANLRLFRRHLTISRRLVDRFARVAALLVLASVAASAQSTTTLLPDATVLPRRSFGVRVLSGFTRFDALLGTGAIQNLAASLNADSLGVAQLPILTPEQTAIQNLTGQSAFRLSAGNLSTVGNARIVTAPLILEYGLTSRLTVGVVIPLVETRTTLTSRLNPHDSLSTANVGVNAALLNGNYAITNAVFSSFSSAITSLNAAIASCRANSAGTGCTAILAQGPALITTSTQFSAAVASLYGVNTSTPGEPVVPLANSAAQATINQRLRGLASQFQTLLGTTPIPAQDTLVGSQSLLANAQLNGLLTVLGHDTLQSTNRSSFGDISVGARFQLADTFSGDTTAAAMSALRYRLAVSGSFRFGTGEPANRNRFFDLSTGYGQPGFEGAIATDIARGRHLSATFTGSYIAQFGSIDVNRIPNANNAAFPLSEAFPGTFSAGNVATFSAIPRWRIGGYFSLDGHYNLINVAADKYTLGTPPQLLTTVQGDAIPLVEPTVASGNAAGTVQQIGIGFSYSTNTGVARGPGAIPAEIVYSHLETMSVSGGPLPKTFRDQIEVRLYVFK